LDFVAEYRLLLLAMWTKNTILFISLICEMVIMYALLSSLDSILDQINKSMWNYFQNCQIIYKYKLLLLLLKKLLSWNTEQIMKKHYDICFFGGY
jgi:hypothetical protein